MGCASVGFILTDKKPVFDILSTIRSSLKNFGANKIKDARICFPEEYVTIDFSYQHDERMLSVYFDCDSDYSDTVYGDKVIFSLAAISDGPDIIRELCIDLSQFGRVFYTPNDCEYDPEELV